MLEVTIGVFVMKSKETGEFFSRYLLGFGYLTTTFAYCQVVDAVTTYLRQVISSRMHVYHQ